MLLLSDELSLQTARIFLRVNFHCQIKREETKRKFRSTESTDMNEVIKIIENQREEREVNDCLNDKFAVSNAIILTCFSD